MFPALLTTRVRLPLFVSVPLSVRSLVPPTVALPVVTATRVTLLEMVRAPPEAIIVGVFALVPPSVTPLVPNAELFPIPTVPLITVVVPLYVFPPESVSVPVPP